MSEFKKGDRVRLTDNNGGFGEKGAEGTVESDHEAPLYFVQFDQSFRGHRGWYAGYNGNLELIKEEPVQDEMSEVKIGDTVECTNNDEQSKWFTVGRHYIVRAVSVPVTGQIEVMDDDGDIMYLDTYEYRKVAPTPRFVTMWDYEHSFHPTGDKPFLTKEEAEAHALAVLNSGEHHSGTISVFEVVSKHTVALAVTSVAA